MGDKFREAHDHGLQYDMNVLLGRRSALGLFVSAGAAYVVAACSSETGFEDDSNADSSDTGAEGSSDGGSSETEDAVEGTCLADPEETAGPYPADGSNSANGSVANVLLQSGIVRTDMASSFGAYSGVADGVPLTLTVTVVNANNGCAPLAGYAIYLWHCDALGQYSIYSLPNENYLRAVAVTDENGQATFTTIFPGCYDGRYPHMHFEIYRSLDEASSYRNKLLTSQIAMPENACTAVYTSDALYDASASNFARVSIASDNVFGDNTTAEIAQQTPDLSGDPYNGYSGEILIGVAL